MSTPRVPDDMAGLDGLLIETTGAEIAGVEWVTACDQCSHALEEHGETGCRECSCSLIVLGGAP